MKTHQVVIKSKEIGEERIKEIASAPFEKTRPSKEETRAYLKSFLYFFVAGICGVAISLLLFGLRRIVFAVIIFVISLLAILLSLGELLKTFKDIRKKDAKDTITDFIQIVLTGDDSSEFENKSITYAYNSLRRMVPEVVLPGEQTFFKYIETIREYIKSNVLSDYKDFVNKDSDIALKEYNKKGIAIGNTECVSFDEIMIIPGIASKINSEIVLNYSTFADKDSDKNNKDNLKWTVYASFLFKFEIIMIKSNGYWFFADPLPEFKMISEERGVTTQV
jgi:hypothetical protein